MLRQLCFIVGLLVMSAELFAASSIFKVSDGEQHLYVGGTIHLLRSQDMPLPDAYWQVYSVADELMFETDILSLSQLSIQTKLMQKLMLPPKQDLAAQISDATYLRIQQYLQANQMPTFSFDRYSAEGVYMQINSIEMLKAGFIQPGVDSLLAQQAKTDAKPRLSLETIEQQMQLLSQLGEPADSLIMQTLNELPNMPKQVEQMMQAWRTGDTGLMQQTILTPMQRFLPNLYQRLLVERNQQWIPLIEQQLMDAQVEFVLVGAAHLYGEQSVIALLQAQGYVVEQVR